MGGLNAEVRDWQAEGGGPESVQRSSANQNRRLPGKLRLPRWGSGETENSTTTAPTVAAAHRPEPIAYTQWLRVNLSVLGEAGGFPISGLGGDNGRSGKG